MTTNTHGYTSTAREIVKNFDSILGFTAALARANELAVNTEEDYKKERTLFRFEDDSKLLFDGIAGTFKAI
jgi:precorrin-6B methylase 1